MVKSKKCDRRNLFSGLILAVLLLAGCTSRYTVSSTEYDAYPGEVNQHVRVVEAEPRRVFEIVTDPEGMAALCPAGTVVTYLSPPPYGAGHLVETRVEHIFKLKWQSRVAAVEPYRMIRLNFQSGFFAGGTEIWEFEDLGGRTRVSHTIIVEPSGVLRKTAWWLKVRRKHDRMVERFLDNLQRLAGSQPTAAGSEI